MEIRIDELKAQEMATRLREAFGSADTSQEKALEVLARTLDFPNWETLSGLFEKESNAEASTAKTNPTFVLSEPFILYWEAYACDDHGTGPSFAKVQIDQAFVSNLLDLQATCISKKLGSAEQEIGVEWDDADSYHMQGDEISVGAHSFWVRARPKHANYDVETRSINIKDLLAAIGTTGSPSVSTVELGWADGVLFMSSEGAAIFAEQLAEDDDLKIDEARIDDMPR